MAKRSKEDMALIESLIKKIMMEENETSPSKIAIILKEKYDKKVSKPTLLSMVSQFKDRTNPSDLELEYENHPEIKKINGRITVLETDFKSADNVSDRCRLAGQIDSAQESKMKLKLEIKKREVITANSNKAQYMVRFGEPTVINIKKPFFKTDEKQKALNVEDGDKNI